MIIKSIELVNYRNYDNQLVELSPSLNVLIGNNAQGKTNMLEGIFLCAIGRSPRTTKDKELIKWGCSFSKITLEINKNDGRKKIEMFLFADQNKAIKINSMTIKRMGELMGEFNAIYFSPDELKLVKDAPDERRRFMDIDLSQFSKNYFYSLSKYNEILMQRNKLLKTSSSKSVILDTVGVWNEQLAEYGSKIIFARMGLLDKLKVYANKSHMYLTNKKEKLELSYTGLVADTLFEIKDKLLNEYSNTIDKDIELGYTTVGPHRDDIKITINDIDVRHFGSQGQQRTVALSLKLAELEVFKENLGEYPVLLLDDVLSELDSDRQIKLLEKIKNIQTIITCTDFPFDIPHSTYKVVQGKITE